MVSISAKLMELFLKVTGTVKRNFTGGPDYEDRIRAYQKKPHPLPSAKNRKRADISETELDGHSIWHFEPKDREPVGHMLYFHGGGYVTPAASIHWDFLTHMAKEHGIASAAPRYPLAPEYRAQQISDFAIKAYQQFLANHDGPFIMGGDSAGGGMTAMVAQAARDQGLRAASGLLLICPWLDAAADHDDQVDLEKRDCMLSISGLRDAGKLYAGDLSISDPRVSPINGNWDALPEILCYAGGADMLVTDARTLKAKRPDIKYIELDDMMHIWPVAFFPESRKAQKEIAEFALRVGQR